MFSTQVEWVAIGVSVPESLPSAQRALVLDAVREVSKALSQTGAGGGGGGVGGAAGEVKVELVNETLALALQYACIPPFTAKAFVSVDFGASKVPLYVC